MNPSIHPPLLRSPEPPLRAYVSSVILLLPAFASWIFASLFLQARLEMIWQRAGLAHSRAQWLISFSDGCRRSFWFIVAGAVLLLLFMELRVRLWPRYRRVALLLATVTLNAAAFIWVLTIATAALLATPILIERPTDPAQAGKALP